MMEEKNNINIYNLIDLSMTNNKNLDNYSINDFYPYIKLISKIRKDVIK